MKHIHQRFTQHCLVVLVVTVIIFSIQTVTAQELNIPIPPSPTSAQFQRYGEYPVGYYTGIPDIRIPIYTIQTGDITVPIYLSYYAAGTKTEEESGYVGLGWTLNTGGMISRVINGIPDEKSITGIMPDFANMADDAFFTAHTSQAMKKYVNNFDDSELDEYSYNFPGHSGKFLDPVNLSDTSDWKPFRLNVNDNLRFSDKNTIVDEKGISYNFAQEYLGGQVEYTDYNNGGTVMHSAVSTWHLGGIRSTRYPSSRVSYSYQEGPQYQKSNFSSQYILDDSFNIGLTFPYMIGDYESTSYRRTYHTYLPRKISFPTGYLLFNVNSSTKYLETIQIFDNNDKLLKTVSLNQINFSNTHLSKLQSVTFKGAADEAEETYSFNYFNDGSGSTLNEPTAGKDHWGFYNGHNAGGDYLLRYHNFYASIGSVDGPIDMGGYSSKEPSESYTKTYVLNKITYPSGGYTVFDFEGNRNNAGVAFGGLRIKTISSYLSGGELANQKSYSYQSNNEEIVPDQSMYVHQGTVVIDEVNNARRNFLSEYSLVNLTPKGSPITYNRVTETNGLYTTTYQYDDEMPYTYELLNYPGYFYGYGPAFTPFTNNYKPWVYGNLISKDITGPGFSRIENNEYGDFLLDTAHDELIERAVYFISSSGNTSESAMEGSFQTFHKGVFNVANRYHYSGGRRLINQQVYEFNAGQTIFTQTNYEYNNPLYPTQVSQSTTTSSKGDVLHVDSKYAYDYPGIAPYTDMVTLNQTSPVIEQTQTNVTKNKEISKIKTNYAYFNPTSSSPGIIAPASIQRSRGGGTLETEETADLYDLSGNILQRTGRGGVVSSYLYGYQSDRLVAGITGAGYSAASALVNQSILNSLSTTETDMRNQLTALRNGLSGAQISSYIYKPLVGVVSQTDPKGMTTTYEYDNFQRLKTIKGQDGKIIKHYDYHYKP